MVIMNKQKNSKKIVNIAWIYSNTRTGFHTDFSYKSLETIAFNGKLF